MTKRRRVKQTQDARLMRTATAYARLAEKAYRAGDLNGWVSYHKLANRARDRAYRIRERREGR